MAKGEIPGPPLRPLGTRVGKFINRRAKLAEQEAEELKASPETIRLKYAKKRGKLKCETDGDVLRELGLDVTKDEDCKIYGES